MSKRGRKRHSPEQIIRKLREPEAMLAVGKTMGQVVQTLEVSDQTYHRWRNQYGGMKAEEADRLTHERLYTFARVVGFTQSHTRGGYSTRRYTREEYGDVVTGA